MKADFDAAMPVLLVSEGGFVDNKKDPGGRTNKGVTQRVYNGYRRNQGQPIRDVKLIEDLEVFAIYRANYWAAVKGDDLPTGVSYVVFDGAVNSGPAQAVKWLQRALGVKVDGHIGQATVAAAIDHPDHDALIASICDQRLKFMEALKTWDTFGKGWAKRVAQVQERGQCWASGSVGPEPEHIELANVKATIDQAKPVPLAGLGSTAMGGGLATGGMAGALQKAQDALSPYAGTSELIQKAIAVLVAAGVVVTLVGGAYAYWAKQKAAERADALDLGAAA